MRCKWQCLFYVIDNFFLYKKKLNLSKIVKIKRIVEISQSIISRINKIAAKKDIEFNDEFTNRTELPFKRIKF